jgi:hypothetical protein
MGDLDKEDWAVMLFTDGYLQTLMLDGSYFH